MHPSDIVFIFNLSSHSRHSLIVLALLLLIAVLAQLTLFRRLDRVILSLDSYKPSIFLIFLLLLPQEDLVETAYLVVAVALLS